MGIEELIGKRMRETREAEGSTLDQIGQRLGEQLGTPSWSRQAVHSAEQGGRKFVASELVAIGRVLNMEVSAMTDGALGWVDSVQEEAATAAPDDVQGQILATLRSIDAKLSPPKIELKSAFKPAGRVFSVGQIIPDDVDLVHVGAGVRWKRDTGPHGVPLDSWYPRDGEGPMISGNELLTRSGHVTEIPAPDGAGT